MSYVTRFAPSPSGYLHLGHAFSAITAYDRAQARGGTFLLRIEDLDSARSKPEYEVAIREDLAWLGLDWSKPELRQSDRRESYAAVIDQLAKMDLCYPCRCRRSDIHAALSAPQEGALVHGPDGPVYPGTCRGRTMEEAGPEDAIRLDIAKAIDKLDGRLRFEETGPLRPGSHEIDTGSMVHEVGDVALARRGMGASYHLAVVVDDAHQRISEVVRGEDLFEATRIHALLQALLGLDRPAYHHHELVRDEAGKRLAKRDNARSIREFRKAGKKLKEVRELVGLGQPMRGESNVPGSGGDSLEQPPTATK